MTPRVVATDLDGTIVRSDGTVSVRTRDALGAAEAAGAAVLVVTGRPPRWLSGIADATGHHGLAICANGALVWDLHADRLVASHPLLAAEARAVVEALRAALPDVSFAAESVDGAFTHERRYVPRWSMDDRMTVGELADLVAQPLAKLLVRHEAMSADELLAAARTVVPPDLAALTHSSREGLLEVSAAGVTKASALTRLCDDLGFGPADVVAFGDMPNDLPMLSWAGHSVAVANAHPEVLAAVDEVTASNDDDGVAVVLERWYAGSDPRAGADERA